VFPDRPALEVDGREHTYAELAGEAASLAATLAAHRAPDGPPLTAVFAYRSATAFAGVLGALLSGHGYVPLNRTFPPERSRAMLERSGCRAVVVDAASEPQLDQILEGAGAPLLLVFPEREEVRELAERWPQHRVLGRPDLIPPGDLGWAPAEAPPQAVAYLLFTSGSTGVPKGVMVSHANARHYIDWTVARYAVTEQDRLSQTFDLTFDLSVHDMFVAWEQGACVCCPTQKQLMKPGGFIRESRLSIWFSVPSTVLFMRRFGLLKPGAYPLLRLSLFCGEALPVEAVRQWAGAAPQSVIENIYGPTELTIACTAYRWDPERSPSECEQGTVPIGLPFDGMEVLVADETLQEVAPGESGELLMAGPQCTPGYWQDEEKTARVFVVPPGRSEVYYRTGDRVRRPTPGRPITYLGRLDTQIKILGHRVELGEIEAAVRQASGVDGVVALGWPLTPSGADGVEVFLQTEDVDAESLRERLKACLPPYMVPRRIHALPAFPLNANGKFDRPALQRTLMPPA
jgi:amino acid adenylation domain-containing protein